MKEVINISLSGISFTIEKDAYNILCEYTNSIEATFANKGDEGKEIISDIEARIAEIIMADKKDITSTIVIEDIEKVISQMGYPETDDSQEPQDEQPKTETPKVKRKLYRKKDGAIIGGVLNGISAYFKISPILPRLALLALFIICMNSSNNSMPSYITLTYIILWIIIPRAKTVIQKLEMEGGDINVNAINNKYTTKDSEDKNTSISDRVLQILLRIFKFVIYTITTIIGFVILIGFILIITVLVGAFSNPDKLALIFEWNTISSFISAITTITIPLVIMVLIYVGSFLVVKIKRVVWASLILVWILTAAYTVTGFIINSINVEYLNTEPTTIYTNNEIKKLYVKVLDDGADTHNKIDKMFHKKAMYFFEKCADSTFNVVMTKSLEANSFYESEEMLEEFDAPYKIVGDTLYITTGFMMTNSIYKKQNLYYTFYCPENCEIIFNKNIKKNGVFRNPVKPQKEEEKENKKKKVEPNNKQVNVEVTNEQTNIEVTDTSIKIEKTSTNKNGKTTADVVIEDIEVNKNSK
ncbi:MAG: PspC domain-containing protein [Rikenellaceae bacterium]